jgi:hypothetical protein
MVAPPVARADGGGPSVRVMTQNMNEGTDFVELSTAHTLAQFLAAAPSLRNGPPRWP